MEENKINSQEPANSAARIFKGLTITAGFVGALMLALISPLGELLFYAFSLFSIETKRKQKAGN